MAQRENDGLEQNPTAEAEGVHVSPPLADPPAQGAPATDKMENVKNAGRAVSEALSSLGKTIDARVRHECKEHPYRTIAAAAAMGFAVRNGQAARLLMLAGSKFAVQAFAAARAESENT